MFAFHLWKTNGGVPTPNAHLFDQGIAPPSMNAMPVRPAALTTSVLQIDERDGKLSLATPMGRHWIIGLSCLALPLAFFGLQWASPRTPWVSSLIDSRWLGMLVDWVLPDPSSPPLIMNLAFGAFVLIGLVLLGHRMAAVVDPAGVSLRHSFCWIPYWRIRIPRERIVSFILEENGRRMDGTKLFCIMIDCSAPPEVRCFGFPVARPSDRPSSWREWLTFSLPGQDAADYVLDRVRAVCREGSGSGRGVDS